MNETAKTKILDLHNHKGTDGKIYHDPTPAQYQTFGMERLRYIRKVEPEFYQELLTAGKLNSYLNEIEESAKEEWLEITEAMAKQEGTDEALKARDPMMWVGLMNNHRHCAAEIVRENWVYN